MRIVLFCSGFSAANLRLQPWLTLIEVGRRLVANGHEVMLATDGSKDAAGLPLPAHVFAGLRGTHSAQIVRWLAEHNPDRVVASITPFSLATAGWHRQLGREKAWGFLPYALYSTREFRTAWQHLTSKDRWGFGRNLLVPGWFWRRRLRQRFTGVICQSQRTAGRIGMKNVNLAAYAGQLPKTFIIPPGIDLTAWRPTEPIVKKPGSTTFVYLGSTRSIRGYTVLLEAMAKLPAHIKLCVMARGLEDDGVAELKRGLESRGLADRVRVTGGWQTSEQMKAEMQCALAVVLPFVLVPSEVPVSVLEVVACGTPVIVTDIDGLPESVGEAGVVVVPGDAATLADAMLELAYQPEKVAALRRECLRRREAFQDWDAVAQRWTTVLAL